MLVKYTKSLTLSTLVEDHKRSVCENTSGLQVAHHCFTLRFEVLTVVKTWEKWSLENQTHEIWWCVD
jgi:hypothetical protein